MESRRERLYWRATSALREAEALASIQGVEGPADTAPAPGTESSWLDDWAKRAKHALRRAVALTNSKSKVAVERAHTIVRNIATGARAIWDSEVDADKWKVQKAQDVLTAANRLQTGWQLGSILFTVFLGYVAWKFLLPTVLPHARET